MFAIYGGSSNKNAKPKQDLFGVGLTHNCYIQKLVDGIDSERFQVHTVLLAICKVCPSVPDVQWNGWLFETLLQGNEHTKPTAEER